MDTSCGGDGIRIEFAQSEVGHEYKWLVFHQSKRGSIGKLLAEYKCTDEGPNPDAFIKTISVRNAFRGRNLAIKLLETCKTYLSEDLGCTGVCLEAEEDMSRHGKLVGLYKSAGFKVIPGIKDFKLLYHGDEMYRVVPMRCELRPSDQAIVPWDVLSFSFAMELQNEVIQGEMRECLNVWEMLERFELVNFAKKARSVCLSHGHPDWLQFLVILQLLAVVNEKLTWDSIGGKTFTDKLDTVEFTNIQEPTSEQFVGLHRGQPVWNNDEYLYHVMMKNSLQLPRVALWMVRFRRMSNALEAGLLDGMMNGEDQTMVNWISLFSSLVGELGTCPQEDDIEGCGERSMRQLLMKFSPSPIEW
uniref:Inositol oxygenase n=1 Tax=Mucochytrium quahogii TaxID=96639 RepID=A0A7S2RE40_9STRA|mmetsp:Transcript_19180/g.31443  ORF Transcript_19180/g.31443 Transcript_19180/m.31443 type:complete len:359 (-) Transcript_19180:57-1133(-)